MVTKKPVIRFNPDEIRQQLEAAPVVEPRNRYWEPWEDQILKEFWNKRDPELIAGKLGRSVPACQNHANQLGISHRRPT